MSRIPPASIRIWYRAFLARTQLPPDDEASNFHNYPNKGPHHVAVKA